MKYEIKYDSINQLVNGQRCFYTILNIASTYDIKGKDILNNFSGIISQIIDRHDTTRYYGFSKTNLVDFKRYIDNHGYDFIKKTKRTLSNGNEYYYYQLVFFYDEMERNGIIYDIFYKIDRCIETFGLSFLKDIKYNYINIYTNGSMGNQMYAPSNETTKQLFENLSNSLEDICISIEFNKNKIYRNYNSVKMRTMIYDNFKEAINNRNNDTWMISGGNKLGVICFGRIYRDENNNYRYRCEYNDHFKVDYIKDTVVFYDGDKSFEMVKHFIQGWKTNFVSITQFTEHKDFFFHRLNNDETGKIILHFIKEDKILSGEIRADYHNTLNGKATCRIKKNLKTVYSILKRDYGAICNGEYIVPYSPEENLSSKALYYINKIIINNQLDVDSTNKYNDLLFKRDYDESDILLKWFDFCAGTNKNNNMKIINAYKNMRDNLVEEYKQLGYYMNSYDFTKCNPIPTIKMDKKLQNNFYKTLHIDTKNIIINKINKMKITPIEEKQTYIKGMFFIKNRRGEKNILLGEVPIKKFYNGKDNTIELSYIKLKGEIYNDKVKNR